MSEKLRILVVDDNEEFCQNLADIMEMKGYRVATAQDGFKAIDMVKQGSFDLVLMDIKMPVMNGVETFKKIKEIAPLLPVVMVTAYQVEELIKDALREGAFGCLNKPLDFHKLFETIEAVRAKGALILVADDDQGLCTNMSEILTQRGYQVAIAYDGSTAVLKCWESDFDIILLDMKMPPLNGLETYLAIKEIRPYVVVIVITGYRTEMSALVEQAMRQNAYTCLEKPLDVDNLFSLLEQVKKQKAKGIFHKPR